MIVGFSGNIGSGKTFFSEKVFSKLDNNKWKLIEVDKITEKLYQAKEFIDFIKDYISDKIIVRNNIDKDKLKKIIFDDLELFKIFSLFSWEWIEKYILSLLKTEFNYLIDGAIIHQFKNIEFDLLFFIESKNNIENAIKRIGAEKYKEILWIDNFQSSLKKNAKNLVFIESNNELPETVVKKIINFQ